MRLLIIDPFPDGAVGSLDFAMRAKSAGHDVKYYLRRSTRNEKVGLGLVDCIDDFNKYLLWSDLVFYTDNTSFLDTINRVKREDGQSVIGPNKETASWEIDRERGMQVFKVAGIRVPPYHKFSSYDEAIAFVKRTMKRYVSKPCADKEKSLTYCSKSPQDMIFMLERWKKSNKLNCDFILQEFISGTEMAVGAWCGPNGFIEGFCENFEFKKFMNDDVGVATGEQGTVLRYTKKSKLASKVLSPLEKMIRDQGYCGYIDVNTIIDEFGDAHPLEFTVRPGWPTFNIQEELYLGDTAEWLVELANGNDTRRFDYDNIAIGVVIAIPDYPYSHYTSRDTLDVPVYGLTPDILRHFHPCAMKQGEAPFQIDDKFETKTCLVSAGDYLAVMTAKAPTIAAARNQVYRRVNAIEIPASPMWRTDIGKRLQKQLPELQKHGYALGFRYN